jgi:hypothetical protein
MGNEKVNPEAEQKGAMQNLQVGTNRIFIVAIINLFLHIYM